MHYVNRDRMKYLIQNAAVEQLYFMIYIPEDDDQGYDVDLPKTFLGYLLMQQYHDTVVEELYQRFDARCLFTMEEALSLSILYSRENVLRMVLRHQFPKDTHLKLAVRCNKDNLCRLLLDYGADPNCISDIGHTSPSVREALDECITTRKIVDEVIRLAPFGTGLKPLTLLITTYLIMTQMP